MVLYERDITLLVSALSRQCHCALLGPVYLLGIPPHLIHVRPSFRSPLYMLAIRGCQLDRSAGVPYLSRNRAFLIICRSAEGGLCQPALDGPSSHPVSDSRNLLRQRTDRPEPDRDSDYLFHRHPGNVGIPCPCQKHS